MNDDRQPDGRDNRVPPLALGSAAWLRLQAMEREEMLHALGALDEEGERETKREILGLRDAANHVENLATLVARLVREVRKHEPRSDRARQAMAYLEKNGLAESPLRYSPNEGDEARR